MVSAEKGFLDIVEVLIDHKEIQMNLQNKVMNHILLVKLIK